MTKAPSSLARSATESTTISRLVAVQRWPAWANAALATVAAAMSRSASSSTTETFFPPSSHCRRTFRPASPLRR
jgi:hypothetical protein